jgi:hypothetical protein
MQVPARPASVHKTAGFVIAQEHCIAYCRRRDVMPYRYMQQCAELHVSLTGRVEECLSFMCCFMG